MSRRSGRIFYPGDVVLVRRWDDSTIIGTVLQRGRNDRHIKVRYDGMAYEWIPGGDLTFVPSLDSLLRQAGIGKCSKQRQPTKESL